MVCDHPTSDRQLNVRFVSQLEVGRYGADYRSQTSFEVARLPFRPGRRNGMQLLRCFCDTKNQRGNSLRVGGDSGQGLIFLQPYFSSRCKVFCPSGDHFRFDVPTCHARMKASLAILIDREALMALPYANNDAVASSSVLNRRDDPLHAVWFGVHLEKRTYCFLQVHRQLQVPQSSC